MDECVIERVARCGRPRDPDREEAILTAAVELVAEIGYDRVTVEAVATRARAGKATIYRRWQNKAQLVAEAIRCRSVAQPVIPDTGDVRQDLVLGIGLLVADLVEHHIALLAGLATAMQSDPELAALMREQTVSCRRDAASAWVRRGVERGQLAADADLGLIADLVPATVCLRLLVTGEPVDDAFVVRLVDHVLLPLLTRGAAGAGDHMTPAHGERNHL